MSDQEIREALKQHWTAFDTGDFSTEHNIYYADAVLDYPQARERIIGRHDIQMARTVEAGESRRKRVVNMDSPASRSSESSAASA